MDDLARKLDRVREEVRPEWTGERQDAVLLAMHLRRKARARKNVALAVVACVACLVVVGARWQWGATSLPALAPAAPPHNLPADALVFEDGSTVVPIDAAAGAHGRVALREKTAARVVVRVEGGAAHCDITHAESRVFRVELGDVAVQVLGTAFDVERLGDGVRVSVQRGKVRVFWSGHATDLGEGESGLFPATNAPSTDVEETPAPRGPVAEAPSAAPAAHAPPVTWKKLAEQGEFDEAYVALHKEGAPAVNDEVGELLLAADVARLSHHPAEAEPPLRQVLDRHGADPRASLAAFTLGRLLLESLGRPGEAADAFARARALAPGGMLAQDALAREVECRSRAGDTQRAHDLAVEYVGRYPDGSRVRSVRRFGGLE